jgi:amino acid transporter
VAGTSPQAGGLRRSLSVWQAIGLSIALMAPSMAANINPQASAATAGRAVPLAFLIAAVGVLLVAYVLATIGCVILVFVRRRLPVPMWQVVIPLAALVVIGYTLYRNVIPYPPSGPGRWFPVVSGGWLAAALIVAVVAPGFARRLGAALTAREGIAPEPGAAAPSGALPATDPARDQASGA